MSARRRPAGASHSRLNSPASGGRLGLQRTPQGASNSAGKLKSPPVSGGGASTLGEWESRQMATTESTWSRVPESVRESVKRAHEVLRPGGATAEEPKLNANSPHVSASLLRRVDDAVNQQRPMNVSWRGTVESAASPLMSPPATPAYASTKTPANDSTLGRTRTGATDAVAASRARDEALAAAARAMEAAASARAAAESVVARDSAQAAEASSSAQIAVDAAQRAEAAVAAAARAHEQRLFAAIGDASAEAREAATSATNDLAAELRGALDEERARREAIERRWSEELIGMNEQATADVTAQLREALDNERAAREASERRYFAELDGMRHELAQLRAAQSPAVSSVAAESLRSAVGEIRSAQDESLQEMGVMGDELVRLRARVNNAEESARGAIDHVAMEAAKRGEADSRLMDCVTALQDALGEQAGTTSIESESAERQAWSHDVEMRVGALEDKADVSAATSERLTDSLARLNDLIGAAQADRQNLAKRVDEMSAESKDYAALPRRLDNLESSVASASAGVDESLGIAKRANSTAERISEQVWQLKSDLAEMTSLSRRVASLESGAEHTESSVSTRVDETMRVVATMRDGLEQVRKSVDIAAKERRELAESAAATRAIAQAAHQEAKAAVHDSTQTLSDYAHEFSSQRETSEAARAAASAAAKDASEAREAASSALKVAQEAADQLVEAMAEATALQATMSVAATSRNGAHQLSDTSHADLASVPLGIQQLAQLTGRVTRLAYRGAPEGALAELVENVRALIADKMQMVAENLPERVRALEESVHSEGARVKNDVRDRMEVIAAEARSAVSACADASSMAKAAQASGDAAVAAAAEALTKADSAVAMAAASAARAEQKADAAFATAAAAGAAAEKKADQAALASADAAEKAVSSSAVSKEAREGCERALETCRKLCGDAVAAARGTQTKASNALEFAKRALVAAEGATANGSPMSKLERAGVSSPSSAVVESFMVRIEAVEHASHSIDRRLGLIFRRVEQLEETGGEALLSAHPDEIAAMTAAAASATGAVRSLSSRMDNAEAALASARDIPRRLQVLESLKESESDLARRVTVLEASATDATAAASATGAVRSLSSRMDNAEAALASARDIPRRLQVLESLKESESDLARRVTVLEASATDATAAASATGAVRSLSSRMDNAEAALASARDTPRRLQVLESLKESESDLARRVTVLEASATDAVSSPLRGSEIVSLPQRLTSVEVALERSTSSLLPRLERVESATHNIGNFSSRIAAAEEAALGARTAAANHTRSIEELETQVHRSLKQGASAVEVAGDAVTRTRACTARVNELEERVATALVSARDASQNAESAKAEIRDARRDASAEARQLRSSVEAAAAATHRLGEWAGKAEDALDRLRRERSSVPASSFVGSPSPAAQTLTASPSPPPVLAMASPSPPPVLAMASPSPPPVLATQLAAGSDDEDYDDPFG